MISTLKSGPCSYESCDSEIAGGGDTHFLPVTASWKDSLREGCDPLRTRVNIGGGSGCVCCARDWSEVADTSLLCAGASLLRRSGSAAAATVPATRLLDWEVGRAEIGGGPERCSESVSDWSLKIIEKRSGEGGQK